MEEVSTTETFGATAAPTTTGTESAPQLESPMVILSSESQSSTTTPVKTPKIRIAGVDGECDCPNYADAPHRKKRCVFNRLLITTSHDDHPDNVTGGDTTFSINHIDTNEEDYGRVLHHAASLFLGMSSLEGNSIKRSTQSHANEQSAAPEEAVSSSVPSPAEDSVIAIEELKLVEIDEAVSSEAVKEVEVEVEKAPQDIPTQSETKPSDNTGIEAREADTTSMHSPSKEESTSSILIEGTVPKASNTTSTPDRCCVVM